MLQRVKESAKVLQAIKRRKAKLLGHIWCMEYLVKHIIKGKIEVRIAVTVRPRGKVKQQLNDLKEKRGYWKLKEEALDRNE
jgi:hypothetical protein